MYLDKPFEDEFTEFIHGKLDELKELFDEKNKQYSGVINPLVNFETGAALANGYFSRVGEEQYSLMYKEAKAYQRKHIAFIATHDISAPKAEESLKDIAVYCLIQMYMIEKWKQERDRLLMEKQDGDKKCRA